MKINGHPFVLMGIYLLAWAGCANFDHPEYTPDLKSNIRKLGEILSARPNIPIDQLANEPAFLMAAILDYRRMFLGKNDSGIDEILQELDIENPDDNLNYKVALSFQARFRNNNLVNWAFPGVHWKYLTLRKKGDAQAVLLFFEGLGITRDRIEF